MFQWRHFKKVLQSRLQKFANEERAQADTLPHGSEKYELARKVRQAHTAIYLDDWANSSGLQPPK